MSGSYSRSLENQSWTNTFFTDLFYLSIYPESFRYLWGSISWKISFHILAISWCVFNLNDLTVLLFRRMHKEGLISRLEIVKPFLYMLVNTALKKKTNYFQSFEKKTSLMQSHSSRSWVTDSLGQLYPKGRGSHTQSPPLYPNSWGLCHCAWHTVGALKLLDEWMNMSVTLLTRISVTFVSITVCWNSPRVTALKHFVLGLIYILKKHWDLQKAFTKSFCLYRLLL